MTITVERFRRAETLLQVVLGPQAADYVCTVVTLCAKIDIPDPNILNEATISLAVLASRLDQDVLEMMRRLHYADHTFADAFGISMFADRNESTGRTAESPLFLSEAFVAVVNGLGVEAFPKSASAVVPDAATRSWIEVLARAAATNAPMPFLYRRDEQRSGSFDDFADVASAVIAVPSLSGDVVVLAGNPYAYPTLPPTAAILSALLNSDVTLVIVATSMFTMVSEADDDFCGADEERPLKPKGAIATPNADGQRLLAMLPHLPITVLVSVAAHAKLPPDVVNSFFGSFASFRRDRHVAIAALKAAAGWPLSDLAAERLVTLYPDPAKAAALLKHAPLLVATSPHSLSGGLEHDGAADVDRLVSRLAASLSGHADTPSSIGPKMPRGTFYRELITCDEARLLFDNGSALLAAGAKIALTGVAGTGKSEAASMICRTMGCETMAVQSSDILAYRLGAMERNLARVFQVARDHGNMVLVFDEFDSMGSSRSHAGSASYIISLTNSLLVEFDAHPLPIIVISNFFDRIDEAVRRRMDIVAQFNALPDDREHRAWSLILGLNDIRETIGNTVVSDYTHARKMRTLTGDGSATAMLAAVRRARDVRMGEAGDRRRAGFL